MRRGRLSVEQDLTGKQGRKAVQYTREIHMEPDKLTSSSSLHAKLGSMLIFPVVCLHVLSFKPQLDRC